MTILDLWFAMSRPTAHDNNNSNNHLVRTPPCLFTLSGSITVRASSPNSWGELFYKGLSVYPIPSYPALLHKDTTSWNKADQDYIQDQTSSMNTKLCCLLDKIRQRRTSGIHTQHMQMDRWRPQGLPRGSQGGPRDPRRGLEAKNMKFLK